MDDVRRRFLFAARQRVIDQLLSGWRRRGASLLHIGLKGELSPECFWEAGFDVTVLDRSPERIALSREETGPKIEYVCGSADHLPFGDGEFDYAVLVHQGLKRRAGAGIGSGLAGDGTPMELCEALRVASSGVIILEWNRFSLAGVPDLEQERRGEAKRKSGVLPWELWGLVGRACPRRRRHLVSTLPLWEGTWLCGEGGFVAGIRKALVPINLTPAALPFGAALGVRVDWRALPLTPAGVLRSAAEKLCPAKPQEELIGRRTANAVLPLSANKRKNV